MDIIQTIKDSNPSLIIFFITSLIAFLTWMIKGIIEKPISDSKLMFEKTYSIRIEILTEIKNRLSLILYFKDGKENKKFKEQIQELILKDGKTAYLSKEVLDNVILISITDENDNELIKKTIDLINTDLYKIISKIEDEIKFFKKFSNYNPLKKSIGIILISLQNLISFFIIGFILFINIYWLLNGSVGLQILVGIILILLLFISDWWLKKK